MGWKMVTVVEMITIRMKMLSVGVIILITTTTIMTVIMSNDDNDGKNSITPLPLSHPCLPTPPNQLLQTYTYVEFLKAYRPPTPLPAPTPHYICIFHAANHVGKQNICTVHC